MHTHDARRVSMERTAGVSSRDITLTKKSGCLTKTGASSLDCTSPLAVITVVGLLDVLMVYNSAELRCFLLTIYAYSLLNKIRTLFLPPLLLTQPGVPIHPRESRMQPCLYVSQDSELCFGHIGDLSSNFIA